MIGKHFTQEMELMEAIDVGLYTEGSLLSDIFGVLCKGVLLQLGRKSCSNSCHILIM
jgi:hypothetical protein